MPTLLLREEKTFPTSRAQSKDLEVRRIDTATKGFERKGFHKSESRLQKRLMGFEGEELGKEELEAGREMREAKQSLKVARVMIQRLQSKHDSHQVQLWQATWP